MWISFVECKLKGKESIFDVTNYITRSKPLCWARVHPLYYCRLNLTTSHPNSPIPQSMTFSSTLHVTVSPTASHSTTPDTSSPILYIQELPFQLPRLHSPRPLTMGYDTSQLVFKLCRYPKNSKITTMYRFILLEILNSFPGAILLHWLFQIGNLAGFEYSIGDQTFAFRYRDSTSILSPELQAIFQCL